MLVPPVFFHSPKQPHCVYACPYCDADLVAKTPLVWSSYGAIALAIIVGLVGGALVGGLQSADLHNPEMFANHMSTAAQKGWHGFSHWVHQLAAKLR